MLVRSFVVASLVTLASLAINVATAQDAMAPSKPAAIDGISFFDSNAGFGGARFNLTVGEERTARFPGIGIASSERSSSEDSRRGYEVALGASRIGGSPLDVAIAQRGSIGVDRSGDISRRGRGAELRLGRGVNMPRARAASWDNPTWYMFTAVDDEAVTWRPGARNDFGDSGPSFALQDRVEIGDRQAGVTYERGPIQASLAYVERTVDAHTATRTISRDERFAGITLTMRH